MTLQEYINGLLELLGEHPEMADVEVVYAKDDEGNGYSSSIFAPSIRYMLESEDSYYLETLIDKEGDPESYEDYKDELIPVVLIN